MKNIRVLSISPSARILGFAVMEGKNSLVAWGSKGARDGNKNARCLAKINELIALYEPGVLVIEDITAPECQRSKRIQNLLKRVATAATSRNLRVVAVSRKTLRQGFFAGSQGTKHALAEILAKRFPEQLAHLLPSTRRAWEAENYHMPLFDAVALVTHFASISGSL